MPAGHLTAADVDVTGGFGASLHPMPSRSGLLSLKSRFSGVSFIVSIPVSSEIATDFSRSEGDSVRIDGDGDFKAEQVGADFRMWLIYGEAAPQDHRAHLA